VGDISQTKTGGKIIEPTPREDMKVAGKKGKRRERGRKNHRPIRDSLSAFTLTLSGIRGSRSYIVYGTRDYGILHKIREGLNRKERAFR